MNPISKLQYTKNYFQCYQNMINEVVNNHIKFNINVIDCDNIEISIDTYKFYDITELTSSDTDCYTFNNAADLLYKYRTSIGDNRFIPSLKSYYIVKDYCDILNWELYHNGIFKDSMYMFSAPEKYAIKIDNEFMFFDNANEIIRIFRLNDMPILL